MVPLHTFHTLFFFYISCSRKITITVKKNKNSRTSSWLNRCGPDISGRYPLPRLIWQVVLQSVTKRLRQRYEGLETEQSEWKQQTGYKEATAALCIINSMRRCRSWDARRGAANNVHIRLFSWHIICFLLEGNDTMDTIFVEKQWLSAPLCLFFLLVHFHCSFANAARSLWNWGMSASNTDSNRRP